MSNSEQIIILIIAVVVIGGIYTAGYFLQRTLRRKARNMHSEKYAQRQNIIHPQTEAKLSDLYEKDGI